MTTSAQLRAGRALVGLALDEVARRAGIPAETLERAEAGDPLPASEAVAAIRRTLTEAGVIFLPSNGEGPGVRLRKTLHDEGIRVDQLTTENDI